MENRLHRIYSIIDYVLFGALLSLEVYVIAWKLKFKMDKAGYLILLTQLIVMFSKLFHSQQRNLIQPILVLVGYTISEATLFFFVFEMKYVQLKIKSATVEQYKHAKLPLKKIKYSLFTILFIIHLPGILTAYIYSTLYNHVEYFDLILACLILTRITYTYIFGFMYSQFMRLLLFFLEKKKSMS